MKSTTLAGLGLALLLSTAACHRAAPVAASHPPDTTPVATPPPSSTPAPAPRSSGPTASPSQQRAETPRQPGVMPPEVRATLNEKLARLEDAMFDYDKSTIRPDASNALKDDVGVIRDILANYPNQKLLIEGHCDERGSEEYNLALGDRRAKASEEFLSSMGIPNSQLTIISFGKDRPVCTDQSEDCWQKNRRAHVTAAP
jgi:peptidoglycan-associated lipoprotein